ncbi:Basic 7S globulin [Spatholobus suberectus]|nr:Basic 7S globulin [Spatholobus suberectus]
MASSSAIHFFLLSIALFSLSCLAASHAPNTKVTKPHPFILPIRKDPATNLFTTSVGIGTPRHNFDLVIDLAGENLWYDCDSHYNSSSYRPIACGSKACPDVGCTGCNGPFKPGCTNNTCPADAINPLAKFIFGGGLGEDFVFILQRQLSGLLSGCVDTDGFTQSTEDGSPLNGLPKNSKGIIGLAKSQLVLPMQLASANKLPPKFSLCLPSSNKQGFTNLLVGAGEHPRGMSKFLQTTPLVVNPVSTGAISVKGVPSKEYFIDVKAVRIDDHVVNLKPSLLSIDNKGNGGTKISTMSPFTELQTSVYKPFVRDFLKKASDRRLKRVASVPPFEACFDSTTIGNSVTGPVVPTIDLVLRGGVQWTIHGANSMVMAKKNVACLAFVDGGTEARMSFVKASIVIGGYQLQDNLLVFDVASSKLSFTSSLLLHNVTCSHS